MYVGFLHGFCQGEEERKKNERDRKISRKPEMVFKEIGNVE